MLLTKGQSSVFLNSTLPPAFTVNQLWEPSSSQRQAKATSSIILFLSTSNCLTLLIILGSSVSKGKSLTCLKEYTKSWFVIWKDKANKSAFEGLVNGRETLDGVFVGLTESRGSSEYEWWWKNQVWLVFDWNQFLKPLWSVDLQLLLKK